MADGSHFNPGSNTVVAADQHAIFALGLVSSLRDVPHITISSQTTQLATLLSLVAQHQPDVVITGYNLQIEKAATVGHAPVPEIGRLSPRSRIIVITPRPSEALRQRLLRAGAHLVQSKACAINTLICGVIGNLKIGNSRNARKPQPAPPSAAHLSPSEKRVLQLYLSGMNVTAIASLLQRSSKTISSQKVSAMRKLGVSSNQELVLLASSLEVR